MPFLSVAKRISAALPTTVRRRFSAFLSASRACFFSVMSLMTESTADLPSEVKGSPVTSTSITGTVEPEILLFCKRRRHLKCLNVVDAFFDVVTVIEDEQRRESIYRSDLRLTMRPRVLLRLD